MILLGNVTILEYSGLKISCLEIATNLAKEAMKMPVTVKLRYMKVNAKDMLYIIYMTVK